MVSTGPNGTTTIGVIASQQVGSETAALIEASNARIVELPLAHYSLTDQAIYEVAIREALTELNVPSSRIVPGPATFLITSESPPSCAAFVEELERALLRVASELTTFARERIGGATIGEDIVFHTDTNAILVPYSAEPCA